MQNKSQIYFKNAQRLRCGWNSFGEFFQALAIPAKKQLIIRNSPQTISTESTGIEGGFLVPPSFAGEIGKRIISNSLLGLCDIHYVSGTNRLLLPADETTPWQTSGGIQTAWEGETDQFSQSKLDLTLKNMKLNKLEALIPISEELLEDSVGLEIYLKKKVPEKLGFAADLAIIQGTGAGEPQGILNCGSLIEIAAESGQSANTVYWENVRNMWARLYGDWQPNSAWVINQDILSQVLDMEAGTNVSIASLLGTQESKRLSLIGRPIIPHQGCETLGDRGDLILGDFSQYLVLLKDEVIREQVSMHVWFDWDVAAFKFVMRMAGQCWLSSAMEPRDGSTTMSAFVTLAARA